jgi:glycosyltransferase involved in cell wall biosynthesis
VFALSSLTEGTSIALLEAMASQVPVVATGVGGTTNLITDGINGVLVASAQVAATADAIGSLLSDEDRAAALGRSARETIVAGYSVERMERAYAVLYQRAAEASLRGAFTLSAPRP